MRVWLDDVRPPRPEPEGWVWVRTPAETIALLETDGACELSLDHDLGLFEGGRELTGGKAVRALEAGRRRTFPRAS